MKTVQKNEDKRPKMGYQCVFFVFTFNQKESTPES